MKLAGKVSKPCAREIVMILSSSGWRKVSRARAPNSGSSSKTRLRDGQVKFHPASPVAAADQTGMANRMMRRPERAVAQKRLIVWYLIGHRIDSDHIERFVN